MTNHSFIYSMSRTALLVLMALVWTHSGSGQSAHASCGDHLHHPMHDLNLAQDGQVPSSVPKCNGITCQSVPLAPPVEPSRMVVMKRQPIGLVFVPATDSDQANVGFFDVDETIPASVILEVVTPPPINKVA
jgi:hypothetical protein